MDEQAEEALQRFGEASGVALLVEQYVWWFLAALIHDVVQLIG